MTDAVLGRLGHRVAREDGSAALEFVTLGVGLLLPVMYLVLTVSLVQANALLIEGLARGTAFVVATSRDPDQAESRIALSIASAAASGGIDQERIGVHVACEPERSCRAPGALVLVRATVGVPLPLVGGVPGVPVSVTLTADSAQRVSRFAVGGGTDAP